jgi:hypothetical protein
MYRIQVPPTRPQRVQYIPSHSALGDKLGGRVVLHERLLFEEQKRQMARTHFEVGHNGARGHYTSLITGGGLVGTR